VSVPPFICSSSQLHQSHLNLPSFAPANTFGKLARGSLLELRRCKVKKFAKPNILTLNIPPHAFPHLSPMPPASVTKHLAILVRHLQLRRCAYSCACCLLKTDPLRRSVLCVQIYPHTAADVDSSVWSLILLFLTLESLLDQNSLDCRTLLHRARASCASLSPTSLPFSPLPQSSTFGVKERRRTKYANDIKENNLCVYKGARDRERV
jgi:hypothetical protein